MVSFRPTSSFGRLYPSYPVYNNITQANTTHASTASTASTGLEQFSSMLSAPSSMDDNLLHSLCLFLPDDSHMTTTTTTTAVAAAAPPSTSSDFFSHILTDHPIRGPAEQLVVPGQLIKDDKENWSDNNTQEEYQVVPAEQAKYDDCIMDNNSPNRPTTIRTLDFSNDIYIPLWAYQSVYCRFQKETFNYGINPFGDYVHLLFPPPSSCSSNLSTAAAAELFIFLDPSNTTNQHRPRPGFRHSSPPLQRPLDDEAMISFIKFLIFYLRYEIQIEKRFKVSRTSSVNVIKTWPPIKAEIHVSNNGLGAVSLTPLFRVLTSFGVQLCHLRAHRNRLADAGCEALGVLLSTTYLPIEELHLSHNHITQTGFKSLLESLIWRNKKLQKAIDNPSPAAHYHPPTCEQPPFIRLEYNCIRDVDNLSNDMRNLGYPLCLSSQSLPREQRCRARRCYTHDLVIICNNTSEKKNPIACLPILKVQSTRPR